MLLENASPRPHPTRAPRALFVLAAAAVLVAGPALAARIEIAGKVVDENGEPLSGAEVSLSAPGTDEPLARDTTKGKGTFELKLDGESGPYRLRVAAEGYGSIDQEVKIQAGTRTEANIPMVPAALATRQKAIDAYNAAVAALQGGDDATGRVELEKAIAADAELPEPHLVLAQLLMDAGENEEAVAEIERYLEMRPDDEQARRVAYEANRRAGNEEGMAEHARFLADTDAAPALAKDVYNQGVALHEEGKQEEALAKFRRALELDPELSPAALAVASVLSVQGDDEGALAALAPVLEREPTNAVALRARFVVLDREDDPQAEDALDAWAAQDEAAAVSFLDERAQRDFEADFLKEAERSLRRLLRIRPDEPEYHYRIGLVYAAQSRPEEAKRHLRRFVELAPDDPEADSARAMIEAL